MALERKSVPMLRDRERKNFLKILLFQTGALIIGVSHLLVDLYQVCSLMPLGWKMALLRGSQVGTWEQRQKISKFFFAETGRLRPLIFGIYLLLVDIYQLRNKEANLQNYSSLKLKGLWLWYLVYSISLQTSTKFVPMMSLGSKLAPPWGSQVGTYRNKDTHLQNSFSLKLEGVAI